MTRNRHPLRSVNDEVAVAPQYGSDDPVEKSRPKRKRGTTAAEDFQLDAEGDKQTVTKKPRIILKGPKKPDERLQQSIEKKKHVRFVEITSALEALSNLDQPQATILPLTEVEKMTQRFENERERRLYATSRAETAEKDLKCVQLAFEDQEQAIGQQHLKAKQLKEQNASLEKKLNDEKVAATLGWKLLRNRKNQIDELKKQAVLAKLAEHRFGMGFVDENALLRARNDAAAADVKQHRTRISELEAELKSKAEERQAERTAALALAEPSRLESAKLSAALVKKDRRIASAFE